MRTHVLLSAFAVFSMFKGDPIGSMGHNVLPHKMLRNVSALRWYGWSVAQAPSLRGPISYGTLTGRLRDKPFEPMPIQTDANSCKSIQNGADPCDLLPIHANRANLFKTASVHWRRCQSTRIHSKCTNQFKPIVSIEIDRYQYHPVKFCANPVDSDVNQILTKQICRHDGLEQFWTTVRGSGAARSNW